ncbi:Methyl-accepting chemotaxis protein [Borrelia duttonii CR2A]|uniref:Methyl-accepting chemotaxis protein n=1 Tax=Borrelia duttonii CR2A TaxID=1432657 RepID=W6U084_9SPIR|nr:Methyl-accepting chemotaxis protein [Borrelia duttonii CR2A]
MKLYFYGLNFGEFFMREDLVSVKLKNMRFFLYLMLFIFICFGFCF